MGEVEPAGHTVHVDKALAPAVTEYVPATQLVHTVELLAPAVTEYLPALQSVHTADPVALLYFPATHAVQVPPFWPV